MIEAKDLLLRAGELRLAGQSWCVPAGAYGVLMGSTGCGKTTLLETLIGLRQVASGKVLLNGQDVTDLDPALRNIGYVPQDGALFETMSVEEQLGFALTVRGVPRGQRRARVRELAAWIGVESQLDRRTRGLSGGERQRVALGRALAAKPSILILDEPLSAVDQDTRSSMYELLQRVHAELQMTVLHVTHFVDEAQRLGTYFLRMDQRGITQTQRPKATAAL
ncbi:MAG: molybdate/tungstate transport system ATP-binding protein [Planctomycetota bacterium]|jgi:molybdate/tungstate transport system ATP-binding protein